MGYTGGLIERAMMDDVGSILLFLHHHRHHLLLLLPPPSTLRGPSICLVLNHVLENSWHFGRPCTIYGSAYRTFSVAYAHTRATPSLFLSRSSRLIVNRVITRIRLRARDIEREFVAREKPQEDFWKSNAGSRGVYKYDLRG